MKPTIPVGKSKSKTPRAPRVSVPRISIGKDPSLVVFESSKDSKKKILKSIFPRRNKAPLRALKNVHTIS